MDGIEGDVLHRHTLGSDSNVLYIFWSVFLFSLFVGSGCNQCAILSFIIFIINALSTNFSAAVGTSL